MTLEKFSDQKPSNMSSKSLQRVFRLLEQEISNFFPLFGDSAFLLPDQGYGMEEILI
jgi:hypothetical protein